MFSTSVFEISPMLGMYELESKNYHSFLWPSVILVLTCCVATLSGMGIRTVKAPIIGYRSIFEPTWLLRLRFLRGSRLILQEGYDQFKNSMFKIRRIGTDVLLLSNKRLDELRVITNDVETSVEPMMNDFVGELTSGPAFLHSDLQNRVLQQKLTPSLALLTPVMKDELDFAMKKEMPTCEEWVTVDIVSISARIVARISARIFLGQHHCRNEEWLTTTAQYTQNLFMTGMFLRMFPKLIRPLIAPFFPPYRQLRGNIVNARRIIGGIVISRRAAEIEQGDTYEKPTDILQWVMDMAVGEETVPENIAQRMLILSLAAIHTTALTMTQALYDLIANPEYFEPIESEVTRVLQEDSGWRKTTLNRFRKLDSLLKESQRFNPVFLVTFNRILHRQVAFSDGLILHPGTRIAVPAYNMLHDAENIPGPMPPSEFDPFRYSRLREDPNHPENAQKFLFAMIDSNNMAFGYGKHACPGRFFTSNEMKMVLAHMLLKYEWGFPVGQTRPKNFTVDTDMYPDRNARVTVRRKRSVDVTIDHLL